MNRLSFKRIYKRLYIFTGIFVCCILIWCRRSWRCGRRSNDRDRFRFWLRYSINMLISSIVYWDSRYTVPKCQFRFFKKKEKSRVSLFLTVVGFDKLLVDFVEYFLFLLHFPLTLHRQPELLKQS